MVTKKLRGVLIDPTNKTIQEIYLSSDEDQMLKDMYKYMDCDMIERVVSRENDLQINLDEEGCFKENNDAFFFKLTFPQYTNPYVGKAIITGYDFTSLDEKITIDFIKANTQFLA